MFYSWLKIWWETKLIDISLVDLFEEISKQPSHVEAEEIFLATFMLT